MPFVAMVSFSALADGGNRKEGIPSEYMLCDEPLAKVATIFYMSSHGTTTALPPTGGQNDPKRAKSPLNAIWGICDFPKVLRQ